MIIKWAEYERASEHWRSFWGGPGHEPCRFWDFLETSTIPLFWNGYTELKESAGNRVRLVAGPNYATVIKVWMAQEGIKDTR